MFVSKKKHDAVVRQLKEQVELLNTTVDRVTDKMDRLHAEYEIKEKKAVAALEARFERDKLTLEKKYMQERADFEKKHLEENFGKLQSSLAKLHEEGNVTTKYMQEITGKLMDNMGRFTAPQLESKKNARNDS